jgi:hypothetical protein
MTAWPDLMAETAAELLAEFGEPATLADTSVVRVLFHAVDQTPPELWREAGMNIQLSVLSQPTIAVPTAAAATFAVGTLLTLRGVDYQVTDPPQIDHSGLALIQLGPADEPDADAELEADPPPMPTPESAP